MPLASCPRCTRPFMKSKSKLVCDRCVDAEDADYQRVRTFVFEHPDCTPAQVAEGMGIDYDIVMRVISAGVIAQVDTKQVVRCGRCGAPAISLAKRLCETCLAELNAELARSKAKIKLPQKKWTNIETGKSSVRQRIEDSKNRNSE